MGNNKEIRQRLETCRTILLVLNWIGAVVLLIVGIVLVNSNVQGIGIGVIIGSIVIGIIGHFLTNVVLAIPFILLNNGDILDSIKTGTSLNGNSSAINDNQNSSPNFTGNGWAKDTVNIREKPELSSGYVSKLHFKEPVIIVETGEKISENNYWIHIKSEDGKDGWCYSEYIEKT